MGGKRGLLLVVLAFLLVFSPVLADASVTQNSGETNLTIFNVTSYVGTTTNFLAYFYNATNATDTITDDASCQISLNGTYIDMTVLPNQNISGNLVSIFVYQPTFTETDSGYFNVSCDGTNESFAQVNATAYFEIFNAYLNTTINSSQGTLVAEDINFTVNVSYTNSSSSEFISGATCAINISGNNYTLTENSSSYYTSLSIATPGTYDYNITCSASDYSSLRVNNSLEVYPYEIGFTSFEDFTEDINYCSNAFVDIDGDGSFEYFFTGKSGISSYLSAGYEYNGSDFEQLDAFNQLSNLSKGSFVFADFDNDGDADYFSCSVEENANSSMFENNGGAFTLRTTSITNVTLCSVSGFDFDNDGDVDILISGQGESGSSDQQTKLYENEGNFVFSEYASLNGSEEATTTFGHINSDTLFDFIVMGNFDSNAINIQSLLYINNLSFNSPLRNISNLTQGSANFFDYDTDGDLDFALMGTSEKLQESNATFLYYENQNGVLTLTQTLDGLFWGAISSADINNDGYGDIYATGNSNVSSTPVSRLYTYNGSSFVVSDKNSTGLLFSSNVLFDYDLDGDVDLAYCGADPSRANVVEANNISQFRVNNPPTPPTITNATYDSSTNTLNISWGNASDDFTPEAGLYYNLRVGTSGNPDSVVSGVYSISSNPQQGYLGNMMQLKNISISTANTDLVIAVQAIDSGLRRSNWSSDYQFNSTVCEIGTANWNVSEDCEKTSQTILFPVDRQIIVSNDATLTLNNVTLSFNNTGIQTSINVTNGTLILTNHTTINAVDANYSIVIEDTLTITNTTLDNLYQFFVSGEDLTVQSSTISCSYCFSLLVNATITNSSITARQQAFSVNNSFVTLTNTTITHLVGTDLFLQNATLNGTNVTYTNFSALDLSLTNASIERNWYVMFSIQDTSNNSINDTTIIVNNSIITDFSVTISDLNVLILLQAKNNISGTFNNSIYLSTIKTGYAQATTSINLTGNSQVNFTLSATNEPSYASFSSSLTTNFTNISIYGDITNVTNARVGVDNAAVIEFNAGIDFSNLNLSNAINLSTNTVVVDVDNFPTLNVPSTITFLNVTYEETPILRKNGVFCNATTCGNQNYLGTNLSFNVSGFSNYTLHPNAELQLLEEQSCNINGSTSEISFEYVNATNDAFISGASCNITISGNTSTMVELSSSYALNISLVETGNVNYTVTCIESGFENVTYSGTVYIRESASEITFNQTSLQGVEQSQALFYDENEDGYPELILTGLNSTRKLYTYNNSAGTLSFTSNLFGSALVRGALASFDVDENNETDFVFSGEGSSDILRTYTYSSGSYTTDTLTGLKQSSLDVADFDNDGDMDFVVTGVPATNLFAGIYENENGSFSPTINFTTGVNIGGVLFIDYNNDSLIDVLLSGANHSSGFNNNKTTIAFTQNSSHQFTQDSSLSITNYSRTILVKGDFNDDGLHDIYISGRNISGNRSAEIYLGNGSTLVYSSTWSNNLIPLDFGSALVVDLDNDGDQDLITLGQNNTNGNQTIFYENTGTTFTVNQYLPGFFEGSIAAADYDQDGDMDLVLTGTNASDEPQTLLLTNDISGCVENSPPATPTSLDVNYDNSSDEVTISWSAPSDDSTSYPTYNVQISNSTHTGALLSAIIPTTSRPANPGFGSYLVPNVTLNIANQCMRVQVQALDNSLASSNWSSEVNYSTTEICDGYDNDCDGVIDEGFDADGDGFYNATVCTGYAILDQCDSDSSTQSTCPTITQALSQNSGGGGGGGAASAFTSNAASDLSSALAENAQQQNQENTQETSTETSTQTSQQSTSESASSSGGGLSASEEYILRDVLQNNIKHNQRFYYDQGTTHIVETIKNHHPYTIHNVVVTLFIPKTVVASAYDISSSQDFVIIQEDPIIQFTIPSLDPFKEFSFEYVIDERIPQNLLLGTIDVDIQLEENNDEEEFTQLIAQTKDVLDIKKNITRDTINNITTYDVALDFKNESVLYDVTVYQEIPKCLIQTIKEEDILSDLDFEIVNVDPLIAWHFDQIVQGEKLNFGIRALADSNCDDNGETLAVAKTILIMNKELNFMNIVLSLALILVSFGTLLFFARFAQSTPQNKVHEVAHKHFTNWEMGVAEAIILLLIALNFLEMFQVLSGDMSFIKNILSWTILSYLLYQESLTKLFFGAKNAFIDIILIGTFFMMTLKNLTALALSSVLEAQLFRDLYILFIRYNNFIETYFFIAGMFVLIGCAIVLAKTPYAKPSVASLLHAGKTTYSRVIVNYVVFVLFFVMVYNLMFEWLAIAIDSQLGVILAVTSLYLVVKHHEKVRPIQMLNQIGDAAEGFYKKVLELFQYKKTFPIALSGMLVLHTISEIGIYILPYTTGLLSDIYSGVNQRYPLFNLLNFNPEVQSLFAQQALGLNLFELSTLFLLYVGNIIFMLYLFGIPIYFWVNMLQNRKKPRALLEPISLKRIHFFFIFFSLGIFLFTPAFSIQVLDFANAGTIDYSELFTGIDIVTQKIATTAVQSYYVLALSLFIAIFFTILSLYKPCKIFLKNTIFGAALLFLVFYILNFFASTILTSLQVFAAKITVQSSLLFVFISIIILANAFFYLGGLYFLCIELWKRREFPFEYVHLRKITRSTNIHDEMYHVHYYNLHDELHHGDAITYAKEYMQKSLELGHDMFRIIEFLKEHDWPESILTQAENSLKGVQQHPAKTHSAKQLEKLKSWLAYHLDQDTTLEAVTEVALKAGWYEDDIYVCLQELHIEDGLVTKDSNPEINKEPPKKEPALLEDKRRHTEIQLQQLKIWFMYRKDKGTSLESLQEQALAHGWYKKDVEYCVKELELLEKLKDKPI